MIQKLLISERVNCRRSAKQPYERKSAAGDSQAVAVTRLYLSGESNFRDLEAAQSTVSSWSPGKNRDSVGTLGELPGSFRQYQSGLCPMPAR